MGSSDGNNDSRVATAFLELVDVFSDAIDTDRYRTLLLQAAGAAHVGDGAILVRDHTGQLRVAVASCEEVLRLQSGEHSVDRRSVVRCTVTGVPVTEELCAADVPFEPYVAEAIRLGFRFEYLFPLSHRDHVLGVLVLLDRRDVRLEATDATVTMSMASVAATMMQQAHNASMAASLVAQLQTALQSRVLVEQAKGVLAERNGHDMDSAFRVMRAKARSERRTMADVAQEIIGRR